MRLLIALISVLLATALPLTCTALDEPVAKDTEEHLWALEDTYVTAYRAADHDAILALLHEDFLGWPDSEDVLTAFAQVPGFLQERYGVPGTWDFRIERKGIRIRGGVAITHYLLVVTPSDAGSGGQPQATRITHTWIREGPDWKILGGMSSVR